MSKSLKFSENNYLDSTSIVHKKELLSNKVIYDSGSNLNGSWIRYEDGTMICYKTITGTIDITTAWGSLYTSLDLQLGDLPQTFTSLPVIIYSPQTQSGTQYMVTGSNGGDHRTNSSCGDICLVRPLSKTDVQFVIDIIAIGCWK